MRLNIDSGLPAFRNLVLILLAFSFPFGKNLTSILLISFVVMSVLERAKRLNDQNADIARIPKETLILFSLPVLYYLWSVVGILYTENMQQGATELTKRISFLFVPFAFIISRRHLTEENINNTLKAFLYGIVIAAFVSLFLGFYNSLHIIDGEITFRTAINDTSYQRGDSFFEQQTQGGNYFFGAQISPFMTNIIYYAIYLSFGIFVWFIVRPIKHKLWLGVLGIVLFVVLFFCDSRGPLISFLLTFLFASIFIFSRMRYGKFILAFLITGAVVTVALSPRISLLIKDFNTIRANVDYKSEESTSLRLIVWDASLDVIQQHWIWGVGTGDADDEILQVTKETNRHAYELGLNAHNQYLQIFIASGIVGFLLLSILLLYPLVHAIKNNSRLLFFFIMIMSFNMFFESLFQVFHGIQFFIFFYCLLVMKSTLRS